MKRIIAVLMLSALLFALLSFTSCNQEIEEEAPASPLTFSVTSNASSFAAGLTVKITVNVRNNSERIAYVGDASSLFSSVATATHENGEFKLESQAHVPSDSTEKRYLETGETVSITYVFETDETSLSGSYTLNFTFGEAEKTINTAFALYGGGSKTTASDSAEATEPDGTEESLPETSDTAGGEA